MRTRHSGRLAGQEWAATAINLDEARSALEASKRGVSEPYTAPNVYFAIHNVEWSDRDRGDVAAFWERLCGGSDPGIDYVYGFMHGVLDRDVAHTFTSSLIEDNDGGVGTFAATVRIKIKRLYLDNSGAAPIDHADADDSPYLRALRREAAVARTQRRQHADDFHPDLDERDWRLVSFLWSNATNYADIRHELQDRYGQTGLDDAETTIRGRVLVALAEVYPELASVIDRFAAVESTL